MVTIFFRTETDWVDKMDNVLPFLSYIYVLDGQRPHFPERYSFRDHQGSIASGSASAHGAQCRWTCHAESYTQTHGCRRKMPDLRTTQHLLQDFPTLWRGVACFRCLAFPA